MPSTIPSDICPHCGNPFPRMTIPAMFGSPERSIPCACDCDGALREERDIRRSERQEQLRRAWENTGVPKRYRNVVPDKSGLEVIESGRGLFLCGPKGTGKTRAACAVLKAYVAKHTSASGWCSARFVSTSAWLDKIQDTYGRWADSAEDAFQRAAGVQFLVLDDIGKVNSRITDWTVGKLFRLVDDRYGDDEKVTVFTSQYRLSELAARLTVGGDVDTPDAMVSRIFETCDQRLFDGPDRRLARRQ